MAEEQLRSRVIGNCRIIGRIGQGGMGSVYRAVHMTLERNIALKILPTEFTRSPEYVARFLREARAVATLNHSNIVGVHDAGEQDGQYYIAMEYVEGASLGGIVRKCGPLHERVVLDLMAQAAKGLGAAHKRNLIHRDIKPENMLVNEEGDLKIVDFGLVLESSSQSHLTRTGTFLGTPTFMSPEQCDGDTADARSDLYSIGATFFAILTGQPPFNAPTALGILYKHKFEAPPDPRTLVKGVSEATCKILLKLMAKKKEDRYQDAKELLADIEKVKHTLPSPPDDWDFEKAIATAKPKLEELPPGALTPAIPPSGAGGDVPTMVHPTSPTARTTPLQQSTPAGAHTGMLPTMIQPQGQGTVGASTPHGSAYDPTMIQPGGHTPTPGPLPADQTPASALAGAPPAARSGGKAMIWIAVAAVVLLAVAAGGFMMVRNSQRDAIVASADEKLDQQDYAGALAVIRRGLNDFSGDETLKGREQKVRKAMMDDINSLVESKELEKAITLARSAEKAFTSDEDFKKLKVDIVGQQKKKFIASIKNLMKDNLFREAMQEVSAAKKIPELFEDKDLQSLNDIAQNDLVLAKTSGLIEVQDLIKEAEAAYKKKDLETAVAKLERAKLVEETNNLSYNLAAPRYREVKYEQLMGQMKKAEEAGQFAEAKSAAQAAADLDSKALVDVQRISTKIELESLRESAKGLAELGLYDKAADELTKALLNAPEEMKQGILDEAARLRVTGLVKRADDLENGENWLQLMITLDKAVRIAPNDKEIQDRFQKAKLKVIAERDYDALYGDGMKNLKQENFDEAVAYFKGALDKRANDKAATEKLNEAMTRKSKVAASQLKDEKKWIESKKEWLAALETAKLSGDEALESEVAAGLKAVEDTLAKVAGDEKAAAALAAEDAKVDAAIRAYEALAVLNPADEGKYKLSLADLNSLKDYLGLLVKGDAALDAKDWGLARKTLDSALTKRSEPVRKALVAFKISMVDVAQNLVEGETYLKNNKIPEGKLKIEQAKNIFEKANTDLKAAKLPTPQNAGDIKKRVDAGLRKIAEIQDLEAGYQAAEKALDWAAAKEKLEALMVANVPGKESYQKQLATVNGRIADEEKLKELTGTAEALLAEAQKIRGPQLNAAYEKAKEARSTIEKTRSIDLAYHKSTFKTRITNASRTLDPLIEDLADEIFRAKRKALMEKNFPPILSNVKSGNFSAAKSTADRAIAEVKDNPGEIAAMRKAIEQLERAQAGVTKSNEALKKIGDALRKGKGVTDVMKNKLYEGVSDVPRKHEESYTRAFTDFSNQKFDESAREALQVATASSQAGGQMVDGIVASLKKMANELRNRQPNPHHSAEVGEISVDDGYSSEDQRRKWQKQAQEIDQFANTMASFRGQVQ